MIFINENNKDKCCGCTACSSICPQNAIKMTEDEEGFLYPIVDKEKCINCGLCDKVCPIKNKKNINNIEPDAYVVRVKDRDTLDKSTSGGAFTPIAKYVISENGVVFGAGFDENFRVMHKQATTNEQLVEFRGSKYVQSYLGQTFKEIKEILQKNILVLFTGTPCQVNGLKNFLNKEYDNLITIDLICHGTPSPKLWKKYLEYQERKNNSTVREVSFRNKTYGYHSGTMKLVFANGKRYYGSARVDFMLKSFLTEISSRNACYNCVFKSKKHSSDFTIYDCWNAKKLVNNLKDDDLGYTNMLVNTDLGKNIFNKIENDLEIYKVNMEQAIKYDGIMVENSAIPNKNRDKYYKDLEEIGIEKTVMKYIPITKKDYIIEKSKKILYKTGVLKILKKIKK